MSRRRALARLFAAIALALFVLIQRPFLARMSERLLERLGSGDHWGSLAWIFFEDRWALTLCVLAMVYFAYRYAAAAREPRRARGQGRNGPADRPDR